MALLIIVSTSDLVQVRLNALLPTRIARCINSRGRGISSGVLFIALLPFLVFFLFFPSFFGGLGIPFRPRGVIRVQSLWFLGLRLRFLGLGVLRVAGLI